MICLQIRPKLSANVASSWNSRLQNSVTSELRGFCKPENDYNLLQETAASGGNHVQPDANDNGLNGALGENEDEEEEEIDDDVSNLSIYLSM